MPFYSHGHRHVAEADHTLSILQRWKLQATHGDQLQLFCLMCELAAGILGICCLSARQTWHTLPEDEREGWMDAVDTFIALLSTLFAFAPPVYTLLSQQKFHEEHDAAMELMNAQLEQLTPVAAYVSRTARYKAFNTDTDVVRYRVVSHEGVAVVPKFESKAEENQQQAVEHNGEQIRLAPGSVIEPMSVQYDDMGVTWLCIERISFSGEGDRQVFVETMEKHSEQTSKTAALINVIERHTDIDIDRDGDVGEAGSVDVIDYSETWCACGDAADPNVILVEHIDETDPLHPHLWKVAADFPDVYTSLNGNNFVTSAHLRYGNVIRGSAPQRVIKKRGSTKERVPRVQTSFVIDGWLLGDCVEKASRKDGTHVGANSFRVKTNEPYMSTFSPSETPSKMKNVYKEKHLLRGDEITSIRQETGLFRGKEKTWHYIKISGDAYIPIMAHGDYQLEPMHEQDLRDIGPRAFKTAAAPQPKLLSEREALPSPGSVSGLQARVRKAGGASARQTRGLFADVAHSARSLAEEAKSSQTGPALFSDSDSGSGSDSGSDTEEHAQREGGEEPLVYFKNPLDVEEQRPSD